MGSAFDFIAKVLDSVSLPFGLLRRRPLAPEPFYYG